MKIPFVGPTYTSRSRDVNYQLCRNFYLENDQSGKNMVALYPTPGLYRTTSVATGPCRGNGIVFQENAYFVLNNALYRFDGVSLTSIGTLNTSSGRVSMAENGSQLIIVDGTDGWSYDGTTFAQITDADFPNATHIKFIDSYFVANNAGTGNFYLSALADGTSWNALDVATAERNPDDLVAIDVTHRELWLFGINTTEVWYNSGDPSFAFIPNQGGFIEWGCAAAFSVAKLNNSLAWLAQTEHGGPVVVSAHGFTPIVISTPALNYEFSTYSTVSDAFAMTYTKGGHEFYELTFPTANKTWLYDALTQQWSELTSAAERHRTSGMVYFNNEHYAGDRQTGNIYRVDFDVYNEVLIEPQSVTLTRSGGTVTATCTAHPFTVAHRVTIKGAIQDDYNGTFDVASTPTADTFTYTISATPTTPATGVITASVEEAIIRTRTSPHLYEGQKRIQYHNLQLDFESGVGATEGQGEDPTASLRWSDDGGFTWSNSHTTSIGKLGKYANRVIWRRLGSSRDRIFEVSIADPVKAVIIDAEANVSLGVS